ncbi:MAG: excinuclease ABC subunit UvrB [Armatimonadetes bacterium]|nr:excinuclease ABC subunit UvrB [Armatimonadota bacterium]
MSTTATRPFKLVAPFPARGDQPRAIAELTEGVNAGYRHQTLLGATGTGKTFTMAQVIANCGRPALVISPNKTLCAQLTSEFREFFPENAVEYFVSYYDYYQPEAYIATSDTYIEKDSSINDEIDRLRHAATQAVLERRDVIVVASVSCIYGLGSPEDYKETILVLRRGQPAPRDFVLRRLIDMQFQRVQMSLDRGTFRLRGEVLEIFPADEEKIIRVDFFGDDAESIQIYHPLTGEVLAHPSRVVVYPAKHFITPWHKMEKAIKAIEAELRERLGYFRERDMLLEAQRLEMRTNYDLEMMREVGFVNGIENYSRHLTSRNEGEPPYTLLDYFPSDFITIVDESHVAVPQIGGMLPGDRSRKDALVRYGFRLPSAYDNRPLTFDEFLDRNHQLIYVSATPGPYELRHCASDPQGRPLEKPHIVEQIIRPTGLVDPQVVVRPVAGQIDDLLGEIRARVRSEERVLVTTLTKKMAEDLTDYLTELGVKVRYLHSEIQTLERIQILRGLRLGEFDVLVGINLLREGLDLPEVSLVAILDADKEGFLRSETSLIQTIGRAARNVSGTVILYADNVTGSIERAVAETERRRAIQIRYNEERKITPETVRKQVRDILEGLNLKPGQSVVSGVAVPKKDELDTDQLEGLIRTLENAMREAAKALQFEKAAALRDEMYALKKALAERYVNAPLTATGDVSLSTGEVSGARRRRIKQEARERSGVVAAASETPVRKRRGRS